MNFKGRKVEGRERQTGRQCEAYPDDLIITVEVSEP